jgi:hypothetical protein
MDRFPPEILEKVLGSLDMRTLCTARLVCKTLSSAASRWVHSIRVSAEYLREHPDTNFGHFPCLAQVAIAGILIEDLPLLALPAVANAVTDVDIQLVDHPLSSSRGPRPTLPRFPNMRSMEIRRFELDNDFDFPPSLQKLVLEDWLCDRNGDAVLRLTGLTSLRLAVYDRQHSAHAFEGLTTLTGLRKLDITGPASMLPCMGALLLLTHLDWACHPHRDSPDTQPIDLAPLTRLQDLVHLGVYMYLDSGLILDHVVTIGLMTSLRSLKLRGKRVALVDLDTSLLTPLSRLTKLFLEEGCMDLSSLQRMNIEGLQDLTLLEAHRWGPEVASVLHRATRLEHLHFTWSYRGGGRMEAGALVLALSQMSRLQSLLLAPGWLRYQSCFQAIGLLTGLTSLHYSGSDISPADVEECARLTKLRTLTLLPNDFSPCGPITSDEFLAVAMLPELKSLVLGKQLGFWGYPATHDFAQWYNGPRHCKGWPPLELEFV